MYTSGRFRFRLYRGGVLEQLARKTYHIYMHPNSACTKITPHLHTQLPQFCMYAKHIWPTYIIVSILHVRKTHLAYIRATTINQTRGNNKKINQRPAYMHIVREAFAEAPTPTPMPSAAPKASFKIGKNSEDR